MTSASSQRSHRKSVTWLFFILLIIYLLYSSKLILNNDDSSDCVNTSSNISTTEAFSTNSSSLTFQERQERTKEYVRAKEPELKHIVFGIAASSNLWEKRKEYIKLWWRPGETRGVVWLDKNVKTNRNEALPDIKISGSIFFSFGN